MIFTSGGIMAELPDSIKKVSDGFTSDLRECFGPSLVSVVLYGPSARGEGEKERFRHRFMVVVEDNTPSALAPCSAFVNRWKKKGIGIPLIITPGYIENSLDTFPLEFMEMKNSYAVVYGSDPLAGIEFRAADVRSQCEREIKGKLLHLRAEYLDLRGNWKELAHLVHRSLETFRLVFTGALFLKKHPAPGKTAELIDAVAVEYGLDVALLRKLLDFSRGALKPGHEETDRLFDLYVEELDTLSRALNAFPVTEE
jgi:hypothetical protein